MALTKKSAFILLPLLATAPAFAAGDGGVSPYAYQLTEIFGLPVTNAMVTTWVISLLLIVLIKVLVGKPTLIPSKGQAVVENAVIGIRNIMEPIVGRRVINHVFPLLITLFLFILIMNWSGLFPGVGSFGHIAYEPVTAEQAVHMEAAGKAVTNIDGQFYSEHFKYYFRPANSDLNMTLALGIVSFIAWIWFVLRYAGLKALLFDIFGNKADKKEMPIAIYLSLFIVFIAVGFIETLSILSRLISLPFRLFGNVFGGENLLASMHGMVGWIVPIPFFFLEVLIGLVQALVFTLLTAVYIGLIVNHGDEEHH